MAHRASSRQEANTASHHGQTITVTHTESINQMIKDKAAYCKTLILKLTGQRSEDKGTEIRRITDDMKRDVSSNIDNILEHVIRARPEPDSANYEQAIVLYEKLIDEVQNVLEMLDKTFTGILGDFKDAVDRLWEAIKGGDEKEREVAEGHFRSILDNYSGQWDEAFANANKTLKAFKERLAEQEAKHSAQ